jgi:hypothetical protein
MPGVCSYGFFSFFRNRKKSILSQKKQNTKKLDPLWISPFPLPNPKEGGGELNVGLTRLPPYPPAFLYSPLPGGVCVFLPRWQWVSLRRGIPLKKMVWNLFKRWRWDRRFGLRIKFKHRSFRSEPHRFFSVGVRHTCIFSLRRELQEKTNTGLKDSYTYPDKNTCAFAQHPCHPM